MNSYDGHTFDPLLDTLMQTQYTLFAAALFVGCTIVDAQFGPGEATSLPPAVIAAPQSAASARDHRPAATPGQVRVCQRSAPASGS